MRRRRNLVRPSNVHPCSGKTFPSLRPRRARSHNHSRGHNQSSIRSRSLNSINSRSFVRSHNPSSIRSRSLVRSRRRHRAPLPRRILPPPLAMTTRSTSSNKSLPA